MGDQVVDWLDTVVQLAGYMAGWEYNCFIMVLDGYCGWVAFLLVSLL